MSQSDGWTVHKTRKDGSIDYRRAHPVTGHYGQPRYDKIFLESDGTVYAESAQGVTRKLPSVDAAKAWHDGRIA
jgi:hypothetical protein